MGYDPIDMADCVYLDTSVISALFDERDDPICQVQRMQTRQWHDQQARHYDLVASAIVVEELRTGTYDHQAEAVSFAEGLALLPIDDEVFGVAKVYTDRDVIPRSSAVDAVHIAVASVNEVDYLLTWNCRHLANPNRIRRIVEVNRRLGLVVPIVVTPAMLYWEDEG